MGFIPYVHMRVYTRARACEGTEGFNYLQTLIIIALNKETK